MYMPTLYHIHVLVLSGNVVFSVTCTPKLFLMYMLYLNTYYMGVSQRSLVQSRVAAGFSWFSKNILKPFLMYVHTCICTTTGLLYCIHTCTCTCTCMLYTHYYRLQDTIHSYEEGVFPQLLETEHVQGLPLMLPCILAGLGVQVESIKQISLIRTEGSV